MQFTTLTFFGAAVAGLLYMLWKGVNQGFEIKILPRTFFLEYYWEVLTCFPSMQFTVHWMYSNQIHRSFLR